tara:strand:+ start:58 stop:288 length:231 start_codon:yes stop_codon:yes gene_type:complete
MPKKKCEYHGEEHEKNSVYMFYNTRYDVHLYTNADGFNQAMIQFDKCDFRNREDWRIYLETACQPAGGENGSKKNK